MLCIWIVQLHIDVCTALSPEYQVWLQGKPKFANVTSNWDLQVVSMIVMYVILTLQLRYLNLVSTAVLARDVRTACRDSCASYWATSSVYSYNIINFMIDLRGDSIAYSCTLLVLQHSIRDTYRGARADVTPPPNNALTYAVLIFS